MTISIRYAHLCYIVHTLNREADIPRGAKLKRKSFFVDERAIRRAKQVLGTATDSEAVRLSVERIAEMEKFWQFMVRSRKSLKPGSIET